MPKARLTRSWCSSIGPKFVPSPSSWPRLRASRSGSPQAAPSRTNTTTPADWYAGAYKLKVASEIANAAKGIGFDASDLMPGKVGAGTFWTQAVQWANAGGTNTDAVLKAIDDSWPAS